MIRSYALSIALAAFMVVFSVSNCKSQNSVEIQDSQKNQKTDTEKVQPVNQVQTQKIITIMPVSATAKKLGEHAPDPNDPNYEAKKAEWIKNYPDEYNAVMNHSATPTKNTGSNTESSKTVKKTTDQKSTVDPKGDATIKK